LLPWLQVVSGQNFSSQTLQKKPFSELNNLKTILTVYIIGNYRNQIGKMMGGVWELRECTNKISPVTVPLNQPLCTPRESNYFPGGVYTESVIVLEYMYINFFSIINNII